MIAENDRMNAEIAILIVNGGLDPKQGRWLDLCLPKLQASLVARPFHVYMRIHLRSIFEAQAFPPTLLPKG
ncbi:hypothetical protein EYB53_000800 [Candidatus Chloroploca sp. M-50]|uniref:Uncharacterized protein n=1 Tax=Candidatus Chloroploca mongolica TaxID=2528176 RepID=A0ABS4D480_9CHLR|nr:hypothetical protein [Candidatus Chloroploca mongolica]MBP1464234.1 hypothetical protein [Candidatus Chloroploca mongolica]